MITIRPNKTLTSFLFMLLSVAALAQNQIQPAAPAINAESYVLMDYHSNRILMQKNPHAEVDPASITKMMTAYVVFQEIKNGQLSLEGTATISEKAWRTGGSKMFIEVDKQVNIEDLVRGMIVQSGNDASIALAEHIAGSEEVFASMMNKAASKLGMKNSHFTNATGLPEEGHYMSAYDVALLGQALVREFPDLYHIYSEKEFTYNGIKQHNRNTLLWRDPTVDGFKTGHTESAGYCLATTSSRNGMRLINVVMGTESEKARADETQKMLNYGFRFFETHKLYPAGQQQAVAEVWKGQEEEVALGLANDLFITIPKGSYDRLQAGVDIPGQLEAPIAQGQVLGQLTIRLDDNVIIERPMVALNAVEQGGWWTRTVDGMGLWFKSFGGDD
ncbi:D-alanyl-D-alanine carboxypeptidase family protein [Marinicella gelatinilytica]|uniref:D-alanyl-D-alanine carboxypeptidase family protein n=1 Tax=Marinicella gelatinilytica TaxID=2996017 RepID=UPI002260AFA8|nr:D-alanyl-D-alanine carboxypeptidase family protein [Marinicella gelatinilytica]MCX7545563.1 D-alanyl-D-alanine carboxypeptidase [Marinicella gelatinilytica]